MYPTVMNVMSVIVILSALIWYFYMIIYHLLCLFISLLALHLIAHTVSYCRLSGNFTRNKYVKFLTIKLPYATPS